MFYRILSKSGKIFRINNLRNKKFIETAIKEKLYAIKKINKGIPFRVYIEITNRCNLSCNFCYNKLDSLKNKTMDIVLFEQIIKKIRNTTLEVIITGGEPFLHKDLKEIMNILERYNISCELNTNLTLFSQDFSWIKDKVRIVQISLHTLNNAIAQKIGFNLDIEELKKKITLLDCLEIPFKINYVLTSQNNNIADIKKVLTFLSDFKNFQFIKFLWGIPCVNSTKNNLNFKKISKRIFMIMRSFPDIKYIAPAYPINILNQTCSAGKNTAYINVNRKIYDCIYSSKILGDALNINWIDLWKNYMREEISCLEKLKTDSTSKK